MNEVLSLMILYILYDLGTFFECSFKIYQSYTCNSNPFASDKEIWLLFSIQLLTCQAVSSLSVHRNFIPRMNVFFFQSTRKKQLSAGSQVEYNTRLYVNVMYHIMEVEKCPCLMRIKADHNEPFTLNQKLIENMKSKQETLFYFETSMGYRLSCSKNIDATILFHCGNIN